MSSAVPEGGYRAMNQEQVFRSSNRGLLFKHPTVGAKYTPAHSQKDVKVQTSHSPLLQSAVNNTGCQEVHESHWGSSPNPAMTTKKTVPSLLHTALS